MGKQQTHKPKRATENRKLLPFRIDHQQSASPAQHTPHWSRQTKTGKPHIGLNRDCSTTTLHRPKRTGFHRTFRLIPCNSNANERETSRSVRDCGNPDNSFRKKQRESMQARGPTRSSCITERRLML